MKDEELGRDVRSCGRNRGEGGIVREFIEENRYLRAGGIGGYYC